MHTYHTQYEDYVRYIAKGMVIRPSMVKYIVRGFMSDLDGVICPSEIVYDLLLKYKVAAEKRVIPTGIELEKFQRPEITEDDVADLRSKLGIASDETMLLSLSRVSYEKTSRLCWLLSLLFWRKTTRCVWLWLVTVLTYQILSLKPKTWYSGQGGFHWYDCA